MTLALQLRAKKVFGLMPQLFLVVSCHFLDFYGKYFSQYFFFGPFLGMITQFGISQAGL